MKISVIMASFNSEVTIATAIESFLAQDYPDRELLVIDGASRDGTCGIVQSYASPLITLYSEPDKGIYDAMNKGLARFTGAAFGFLNSDDRYRDPTVLSQLAAALGTADLVTGSLNFVRDHDGSPPLRVWPAELYQAGAFRRGWSLPHPTTYARRAVYDRVGPFDASFRSAGDYDWLLRALEVEGFRHGLVPATLIDMKMGGESTAGLRSFLQNTREYLLSRQRRLGTGAVDMAVIRNILRKLRQLKLRR